MATIRKHRQKWQADVRFKGIRKTKIFKTKMEARRRALEQEENFTPGIHGVRRTFREAMQRYAKEESVNKRGSRWEIIRLEKLCRHPIADIYLRDLNPRISKTG